MAEKKKNNLADVVRTALEQVVQEGSNQLSDVMSLPARGYNALNIRDPEGRALGYEIPVEPIV